MGGQCGCREGQAQSEAWATARDHSESSAILCWKGPNFSTSVFDAFQSGWPRMTVGEASLRKHHESVFRSEGRIRVFQ